MSIPWPMYYLQVCLISKYSLRVSSYLSVFDFQFNFIVVWEHTVYNFCCFQFVKLCFMVQNVVYHGECSPWTWEKCIFCSGSIKCWWTDFEFFNYSSIFFPCTSVTFCLMYYGALLLGAYMLRIVIFLRELTSLSFCNVPFLSLTTLLALKTSLN